MNPLAMMLARLEELRTQSADALTQRGAILDLATAEKRGMTEAETTQHADLTSQRAALEAQIPAVVERVAELEQQEKREAAAAKSRVDTGQDAGQRAATSDTKVTDPPVYAADRTDTSYFLDMFRAQHQSDREAFDRLSRNAKSMKETRALGNTNAVGGSGGEFAPPLWLVDEYVALARPARVAADLFDKQTLPSGISSVNIPRVATGTTTAIQTTQNSALSQTDLTTNALTAGVTTIGGKQVVSLQLLEQSAIPFDRVIMEDLALAYAGALDVQALTGLGTSGSLRGLGSAAGLTVQAYTQATPAVAGTGGFYSNVAQAISKVYATRFLAPDTILMHPRRWAWITAAFDTQNRPLVVPTSYAVNVVATDNTNVAQGPVGSLQGLDVFTDPNLPINLGAGTNQDPVYIFRRSDIKLWETGPKVESFTATYADSAGVLYRLYAYSAMVPDRYGSSIVQINGTGLVTPTF